MNFDLVCWLRRSALPLWANAGVDPTSGMFVERMDLSGRPLLEVPRRVMVQARQTYVFAEAQARGWYPGGVLAERAGNTMVQTFGREDGSWIFSAAPNGHSVVETRDFYAHAFVLFALASLKRLTGADRWLALADATLDFLDTHLATPNVGGYAESLPAQLGPRRQNPHMHLLEALLALDKVAPGGAYRRRAETLIDLFQARFLHGHQPVLVEWYDTDLRPLVHSPFAFEPGHHFEWAWLLSQDAALCGQPQPPALAARLCDTAQRFGSTQEGVFLDEVDDAGQPLTRSTRLWPCTEAIRAATLDFGHVLPSSASMPPAHDLAMAMHARFLVQATEGCWIDHTDAEGRALSVHVPASSLYHLVGAASALETVKLSS